MARNQEVIGLQYTKTISASKDNIIAIAILDVLIPFDLEPIIIREMMRKSPAVNIAVVSLSNTQPSRPIAPPPQPSGAMVIQTAEIATNIIANFFQTLNTCRKRGSGKREGKGGQVPFLGLHGERTVASRPNFLIIFTAHASVPNGFPLITDALMFSSSSFDCDIFTNKR